MPEEKTPAEEEKDTEEQDSEESSEKADVDDDEEEQENEDDEKEDEDDEKEDEEEEDDDDDHEPPVKEDPRDHIIKRLQEKNKKLEKKGSEKSEDDDDDDSVTDEDIKLVSNVFKKMGLDPDILKANHELAQTDRNETALNTFISENPEYKPYKARIEKYVNCPAYSKIPLKQVAFAAVGKNLMKVGANKKKVLDKKADASKSGGEKKKTGAPDYSDPKVLASAQKEVRQKAQRR